MIRLLRALSAYVPLVQTALWIGLIGVVLKIFRTRIEALGDRLATRVEKGDELTTPWFSLKSAPKPIREGQLVGVTTEGVKGSEENPNIVQLLTDKKYPSGIVDNVYLVHTSTVIRPRTAEQRGLYRVRVWVESYDPDVFRGIRSVTYRLYNDEFPKSVIATQARDNSFELWVNLYGEFSIVAYVDRGIAPPLWLVRYLDLPGRPPD